MSLEFVGSQENQKLVGHELHSAGPISEGLVQYQTSMSDP